MLAYLRAGVVVVDVMEMTPDVLDGGRVSESGSLVTDRAWYWREDLAHYVATYHLALGGDFLAAIAARQFALPAMSEAEAIAAGDGTWLLGWGAHLGELLTIENVFFYYPGFAERHWWPIASDGCGNYWVLNGDGVSFIDCAENQEGVAYLAASTLDRFLVPFLLPFLERRGWPFERDTVSAWDPAVLSSDQTKAWD